MSASEPNAESIRFWNESAGPRWVRLQSELDAQLAELGGIVLDASSLSPGERVLDVGCGCGTFALQIARRVGNEGAVCGIDISAPMLEQARKAARDSHLDNVQFLEADAQTYEFAPQSQDALLSRFGVMFFDDPVAAFTNLRRALRPGGRLAFVCFQAMDKNLWATLPVAVVERHTTVERPASPFAPGPFAFADAERVRGILQAGGFSDVSLDGVELDLPIGSGLDPLRAAELLCELGPAGGALRQKPATLRESVVADLSGELGPYRTPSGVRLPCSAWLTRAKVL
jgi:SAM-dependent methyltransferase